MLLNKKILLYFLFGASSFPLILLLKNNSETEDKTFLMLPNYNGQADMMLSLQISPDYYPYQFKQQKLYDYLTDTLSYIEFNENTSDEKKNLAQKLPERIKTLLQDVKKFGPSLWNQDLYDTGIVYRNDQFWTSMKTTYLFIEQFIVDDYMKIFEGVNALPQHEELIVTNFRVARDPYSTFDKTIFDFFKTKFVEKNTKKPKSSTATSKFNEELYKYYEQYSQITPNSLYRFSKFMDFWNSLLDSTASGSTSAIDDFFTLAKDDEKLFYLGDDEIDKQLAEQYIDSIFSDEEKGLLNKWHQLEASTEDWNANYLKNLNKTKPSIKTFHHPALEHQTEKGTSPLSEGSQKDLMVYLYQFASTFKKIAESTEFATKFGKDKRKEFVEKAFNNAKCIAQNYKERIKNIREYFKKLKVIDANFDPDKSNYTNTDSKTLTIITHTPNGLGAGNSTIQSISKFPFIYRDIGFKQLVPNFFNEKKTNPNTNITHDLEDTFSVDDNGWWWNIGNTNIDTNNLKHFTNTSDSVLLLATEDDWNLLSGENNRKLSALSTIFKNDLKFQYDYQKINTHKYPLSFRKYNLWNEGLRSPIAINLLLDNLVEIIKVQYAENLEDHKTEYKKAQDWGNYWTTHFINNTSV